MNSKQHTERYQRQMMLPGFGAERQEMLSRARVLVIGAGGLGCPALQYLAAAGVGTIGIVDDDVVSLSNLHRQVLYNTGDIGLPKAERSAEKLKQANPEIDLIPYQLKLSNGNALDIIRNYDIVLDGTDNFPTRYMVSDACVLTGKPMVYGAISRFEGQVSVFNAADSTGRKMSYRDLFPVPPQQDEVLNCAEAGVLGVLPGIIGTMQANEVIKLITGIGSPLISRLLIYNALSNQVYEMDLQAAQQKDSGIPGNEDDFLSMDYSWFCGISENDTAEIDPDTFDSLIQEREVTVIDVREQGELPDIDEFSYLNIPLSHIKNKIPYIENDKIVTFCQSGQRSLHAAQLLIAKYGSSKEIYSLKGGIEGWLINRRYNE